MRVREVRRRSQLCEGFGGGVLDGQVRCKARFQVVPGKAKTMAFVVLFLGRAVLCRY